MTEPIGWRWLEQPVFVTALLSPQGLSRPQWLARPRLGAGYSRWQAAVRATEILTMWPGWNVLDRAVQKVWYPESSVRGQPSATWQHELEKVHQLVAEGTLLQQALLFASQTLLQHDYRPKRGLAAWFDAQQVGVVSRAQREELVRQMQALPPTTSPNPLYRSAFLSLNANYAVGAAIWIEFYRPELSLSIHDPLNPLASLQGYEVVVWDADHDHELGRGVLELHDGVVTVGVFTRNLSGTTVLGCAFEECEVETANQVLVFTEASRFIPVQEDP